MSNDNKIDQITAIAKRALDILFVTNPRGTSLGVFVGIFIHGLIGFFKPAFASISSVNFEAFQLWHFISMGVIAFNLPEFLKKNKIDPKIEEAFQYIKKQIEAGTVNAWQAQQMYVNLHSKVLSAVVLNEKEEANRRTLEKTLSKGIDIE